MVIFWCRIPTQLEAWLFVSFYFSAIICISYVVLHIYILLCTTVSLYLSQFLYPIFSLINSLPHFGKHLVVLWLLVAYSSFMLYIFAIILFYNNNNFNKSLCQTTHQGALSHLILKYKSLKKKNRNRIYPGFGPWFHL